MIKRLLVNRLFQIFLLLAILAGAVRLQRSETSFLNPVRNIVFDTYNRIFPRRPADNVVIVDIDEDSLAKIGQWPWPHNLLGDLSVKLRGMGARSVGFDIVFSEKDRTSPASLAKRLPQTPETAPLVQSLSAMPDHDDEFAQKISQAGKICLGFVASSQPRAGVPVLKGSWIGNRDQPDPRLFVPAVGYFATALPNLVAAAAGYGCFTSQPDSDGIIRRVPLLVGHRAENGKVDSFFPALSLETLRLALGPEAFYRVNTSAGTAMQAAGIGSIQLGRYTVPTDPTGAIDVYYAGHRPSLFIPAWKVLDGSVDAAKIKDKIVLVGTSAIGLLDLRASPLNPVLPGVETHAEIIEQILHRQFLQRPLWLQTSEILATVVSCLFIIFLAPFIGTGTLAFISSVFIAGGIFGGLYGYQNYGFLVDPVLPSLIYLTLFILSSILTNMRSETEKRAIRQAFSHYISPVLMEELAGHPEKLKLGGEVRELTVMFTDIRNFTAISESMDPADLIKMMNDFLTPMTSCVLENRGTIDKYMGDAMMAFWNAPLDDAEHAQNGCRAALAMVESLKPLNEKMKAAAEKAGREFHELRAGIGLHSGQSSVGNMGSKQRFAYSALGDTVNLASRMESQTKGYGVNIMISEATHKLAPGFAVIELDLLTVKGRSEPERVYALMGPEEMKTRQDFIRFSTLHNDMLEAYRARRWDEALAKGQECRSLRPDLEGLYVLYARRIEAYRQNPPSADWAGVWVAAEK
jgi:adenylate cyclase